MGDGTIRVFLLDDHEVVRRGVADLLDAEPDLAVVGEAATAAEALSRVPAVRPDVAVLDVRLPDGDGVTVCRELRSRLPELQCLMLTSFADDDALFDAVHGRRGRLRAEADPRQRPGRRDPDRGRWTVPAGPADDRPGAGPDAGGGGPHRPAGPALRPGAGGPGADRRGADQPADRRADVPGREDGEELRVHLLAKLGLQRRTQAAVLATEIRRGRDSGRAVGAAGSRQRPRHADVPVRDFEAGTRGGVSRAGRPRPAGCRRRPGRGRRRSGRRAGRPARPG